MRASSIRTFDEYALEYDSWYVEHSTIFESEAKAIEPLRRAGLGLEIGVGTGASRRLGVTVGINPSLGMLRLAKARGIQAVRAVAEHLPFRMRAFEYVLIAGTLRSSSPAGKSTWVQIPPPALSRNLAPSEQDILWDKSLIRGK